MTAKWRGDVTPAMLEAGAEEAIKPPCGIWTPERLEAVYRRMRALDEEPKLVSFNLVGGQVLYVDRDGAVRYAGPGHPGAPDLAHLRR